MKAVKITFAIILASMLNLNPGSAYGEPSNEEGGGRRLKAMRQAFQDLKLSEEQKGKLKALREQKKEGRGKKEELRAKRQELMALLKSPGVSEREALAKVDEVNRLQAESNVARVKHMLELKKILTPEQFEKLRGKVQERMESRGGGKEGKSGSGRLGEFREGRRAFVGRDGGRRGPSQGVDRGGDEERGEPHGGG